MHVGALVERHLLALEAFDRGNGAVRLHEDRFALRCRRLMRHVDEGSPGRLRENRRCLTRRAEVDGAHIEPFEKLGACRKLRPLDRIAKRFQRFLERSPALEQDQRAVFLIPDAQHLRGICSARRNDCNRRSGGTGGKQVASGEGSRHRSSPLSTELVDYLTMAAGQPQEN